MLAMTIYEKNRCSEQFRNVRLKVLKPTFSAFLTHYKVVGTFIRITLSFVS